MILFRLGVVLILTALITGVVEIEAEEGGKEKTSDGAGAAEGEQKTDNKSETPSGEDAMKQKKPGGEEENRAATPSKDGSEDPNTAKDKKKDPPSNPPSAIPPTSVQQQEIKDSTSPKETQHVPKPETNINPPQQNHQSKDIPPEGKEQSGKIKPDSASTTAVEPKPPLDGGKSGSPEQHPQSTPPAEQHPPKPPPQVAPPPSPSVTDTHPPPQQTQHQDPPTPSNAPQPAPNNQQPSGQTVTEPSPQDTKKETESYIMKGIQLFDKKGYVKSLVSNNLVQIPTDLTGKSEEEIKNITKTLIKERHEIQQRHIVHTTFMLLVGVGTHYFKPNIVKGSLKYSAEKDDEYSFAIDSTWIKHQERVANFVLEYMRIKNIKPESLSKSNLDVPFITIKLDEKNSVNLPVWRTQKEAALPPEATSLKSSKAILRNWYIEA